MMIHSLQKGPLLLTKRYVIHQALTITGKNVRSHIKCNQVCGVYYIIPEEGRNQNG
jgi:hypothetical protein